MGEPKAKFYHASNPQELWKATHLPTPENTMGKQKPQIITIEPAEPPREIPILGLSIDEAAQAVGVGRTLMKELIGSGAVKAIRLGRGKKVLVYIEEIHRFMRAETEKAAA